ncbi:ankyrin repeat domain-containing protein [Leptospira jelokensis]|uniref:Ankyrin repeat domain-containing protein n=1 Tax=Leptospira jelokensis TaxID=2484931 RepID=A0A4Z1AA44_9LEPT|nr:ankyrin repeat domain-containing protein [Leptospira jelokensis]TGL74046.1 ankyrin repeat domain-containing protein [Leptospira jelokensis]
MKIKTRAINIILAFLIIGCASDTILIKKIKQENKKESSELIEKDNTLWNQSGALGFKPIHYAAEYGDIELVKKLIQKGANVNEKTGTFFSGSTKDGNLTPLHLAIEYGHLEVAKLLIENGADINSQTYRNYTILTIVWKKAWLAKDLEKLKKEIEFVSSLNTNLEFSDNPLANYIISYYPTLFNNIDLFQSYMQKNLYLNCCNRVASPMLGFANLDSKKQQERQVSLEILKIILEKDIDLNIQNPKEGLSNRTGFQRVFGYENKEATEAKALILKKYPNILTPESKFISSGREFSYFVYDVLIGWWLNFFF